MLGVGDGTQGRQGDVGGTGEDDTHGLIYLRFRNRWWGGRELDGGLLETEPLGLPNLPHGCLAGRGVEPIDEEYAVEMVGLVLQGAGQIVAALDRHRLAVHVEPLGDDETGALAVIGELGQRKAPLRAVLLLLGEVERGFTRCPTSPSTFQVKTRSPTPI